jgi:hypothetical protein
MIDRARRRATLGFVMVLGLGCKGSDERPAPQPPVTTPSPMKWLAIDALGVEVQALRCAELTPIDGKNFGVGPATHDCPIAFPGVVFSTDLSQIAQTLEQEVAYIKTDASPPRVTRAETTPTGWVVEWIRDASPDSPTRPGINQRYHVAGHDFACIAYGSYTPEQMRQLVEICASVRAKR